ncbi:MAG: D-glycerate dehydrogenase [Acidobacteria bacterium]|nr:MAG: D-glycerate dehydrogenase [Acidobacteriota bacterium]REJ99397.1 MAG: D-glycerate dehydrogenase [Acidobacteriota bacterium]
MSRPARIVVSRPLPPDVLARLGEHGSVEVLDVGDDERPTALRRRLAEAEALVCCVTERVDERLLEAAPALRVVANVAVGYDNIDVEAARRRGVTVTNTPDVLSETTAEFALALILATLRRVCEADRFVRSGRWQEWDPQLLVGHDLGGATVGIVGLGRIGGCLARRLRHGFGCRILYWGRRRCDWAERELDARRAEREELLSESRVVSLHLPLDDETRHWIGERELAAMRPDAVLINTARGGVVDEEALVQALRSERIWGAGLDVFANEPTVHDGLLEHPRVVLAPHIGSASERTRRRMAELAADNVIAVLTGQVPPTPVAGRQGDDRCASV